MIPKRHKDTDIASEVAQGRLFRQRLLKAAEEAASRFMDGEDLNDAVAAIAKREGFTRVQIQRLVEEANTLAYNKRYDQVRREKDRRITYEIAELSKVIDRMGLEAPVEEMNPNWVTGEEGGGEMNKAASAEPLQFHNPNANLDAKREKMLEKRASFDKVEKDKQLERLHRSLHSNIFKVANALVMTERLYKTAGTVFNTLLDDVTLPDAAVEGIQKQASEIANVLAQNKKVRQGFTVNLEVNPREKVANLVLGEHSLIGNSSSGRTQDPKVTPTADVATYQQLVDLAKKIEAEQSQAMALQDPTKEV